MILSAAFSSSLSWYVDAERRADVVDDVLVRRRVVAAGGLVADRVGVFPVRVHVAAGHRGAGLGVLLLGLAERRAAAARGRAVAIHVEARGRRLDAISSTSRSCLRSRSRPGARRVSPAPAAVPVERLVGIGLVRPRHGAPGLGRLGERGFAAGAARASRRFAGFGAAFLAASGRRLGRRPAFGLWLWSALLGGSWAFGLSRPLDGALGQTALLTSAPFGAVRGSSAAFRLPGLSPCVPASSPS